MKKIIKKKSTAIAKRETKALTVSDDLFSAHAGAGMENVGVNDLLIPRLAIIQDLSPQIKKKHAKYLEGAEAGMIFDAGTEELMSSPIHFLPVAYSKVWIEWYPRDTQKGLADVHNTDDIMGDTSPNDKGLPVLPNGNIIQETAQFFGINLSDNNRLSFIPMARSQLKRAKRWLTLALSEKVEDSNGNSFTPPLFYRTYLLDGLTENKGEDYWYGWDIQRGPLLSEMDNAKELFDLAITLKEQIAKGQAQADVSSLADSNSVEDI